MSFIAANIEQIENVFGLAVLVVCTVMVFAKRKWTSPDIRLFARGFIGVALLGDSYYTIFTLVFGHNPQYFYAAELAWLAEELFLLLLVIEFYSKEGLLPIHPAAWIGPAAVVALTVWFIVATESVLFNVLMASAMAGIALFSLTGLFRSKGDRAHGIVRHVGLYLATTGFVASEYAMWSISIVNHSTTIANPYYLIQPLMYVAVLCITIAVMHIGKMREGESVEPRDGGDA